MSQLLQYQFCFEAETFNGADVVSLIERHGLGFSPKRILASNAFWMYQPYQSGDLEPIKMEGFGVSLTLYAKVEEGGLTGDQRTFSINERGFEDGERAQMIWLQLLPKDLSTLPLVDELLGHPRLKAAYCGDEEDIWIQNADSPTYYAVRGMSYAHLDVYWDEEWVEERIDISQNPGRSQFIEGYELSSCWRMWFGPKFFGLVPKDKLLAFPNARRIETTEVGHVFIELYADPFEADLAENRRRQQAFRDWIDLDGLAKRLQAEAEAEQ